MGGEMTAVGFEPTQLALAELESTPLDHSGKLSWEKPLPENNKELLTWAFLANTQTALA